jgi:hypothetical protein
MDWLQLLDIIDYIVKMERDGDIYCPVKKLARSVCF